MFAVFRLNTAEADYPKNGDCLPLLSNIRNSVRWVLYNILACLVTYQCLNLAHLNLYAGG